MAGKNQVTLTFAGDSKSLERTFDKVGASAKTMATDTESSFKRVGAGAKALVRSSKGLGNTLSGIQDTSAGISSIMKGDLLGGLISLQAGLTDLAAGVGKFALAFASAAARTVAGWVMMGVQATVNAARMAAAWLISLGPIGLVIAAIGAVIAILVALGVGFDDVKRVAAAAWQFITNTAAAALGWLRRNWPTVLAILTGPFGLAVLAIAKHKDKILGFMQAIPGAIKDFFAGLAATISRPFSSAFAAIKRVWNATLGGFGFSFGGWDPPGPGPKVPGFKFRIPEMHTGGIVPGAPGQDVLTRLQAGERVTPAGRGGGGDLRVHVTGNGGLARLIHEGVRTGQIQLFVDGAGGASRVRARP